MNENQSNQTVVTLVKAMVGFKIPVTVAKMIYFFSEKGDILEDSVGTQYEAQKTGIYAMCGVHEGTCLTPKYYMPVWQESDISFLFYLAKRIKEDELVHVQANIALNGMVKKRKHAPPRRTQSLTTEALKKELEDLKAKLKDRPEHGGSPGEWIWERMSEIRTELKTRAELKRQVKKPHK